MDISKILDELRQERAQLDEAILSIERLALGVNERVIAALEFDPLGDVVEEVGHTSFRIRIGHHP